MRDQYIILPIYYIFLRHNYAKEKYLIQDKPLRSKFKIENLYCKKFIT